MIWNKDKEIYPDGHELFEICCTLPGSRAIPENI